MNEGAEAATNMHSDDVLNSSSDQSSIVKFDNVLFSWPGKNSFSIRIPRFSLYKNENVLLLGPSGSGKTYTSSNFDTASEKYDFDLETTTGSITFS